jgi:hypothetical protein
VTVIGHAAEVALVQGDVRRQRLGNAANLGGDFRPDAVTGKKEEGGHDVQVSELSLPPGGGNGRGWGWKWSG